MSLSPTELTPNYICAVDTISSSRAVAVYTAAYIALSTGGVKPPTDVESLMVWQISHSIKALELLSGRVCYTLDDVVAVGDETNDRDTLTITRHIQCAVDQTAMYITT